MACEVTEAPNAKVSALAIAEHLKPWGIVEVFAAILLSSIHSDKLRCIIKIIEV
jgi:hypothetical protein